MENLILGSYFNVVQDARGPETDDDDGDDDADYDDVNQENPLQPECRCLDHPL